MRFTELNTNVENYVKKASENGFAENLRREGVAYVTSLFPENIAPDSDALALIVDGLKRVYPTFTLPNWSDEERGMRRDRMEQAREKLVDNVMGRVIAKMKAGEFSTTERSNLCLLDTAGTKEADEANLALADAVNKNDLEAIGAAWDRKLAAIDPPTIDELRALSDEELIENYGKFRDLAEVAEESENVLKRANNSELPINESTRAKLEIMKGQMNVYAALQARMELMADPIYEFLDVQALPFGKQAQSFGVAFMELAGNPKLGELTDSGKTLTTLVEHVGCSCLELLADEMRKQGIRPEECTVPTADGSAPLVSEGYSWNGEVDDMGRGMTYGKGICVVDKTGTPNVFRLSEQGSIVRTNAKELAFGGLSEVAQVEKLMDGANRRWLLTGSGEFAQARKLSHLLGKQCKALGDPPSAESRAALKQTLEQILQQTRDYAEKKSTKTTHSALETKRMEAMEALGALAEREMHNLDLYEKVEQLNHAKRERNQAAMTEQYTKAETFEAPSPVTAGVAIDAPMAFAPKEKNALMSEINTKYLNESELNRRQYLTNQRSALRDELYGKMTRSGNDGREINEEKGLLDVRGDAFTPKQQHMAKMAMARMYVLDIVNMERSKIEGEFITPAEDSMEWQLMENGETLIEKIAAEPAFNSLIGEVTPLRFQQFLQKNGPQKMREFKENLGKMQEENIPEKKQPQPSKEQGGKVLGSN